ncbi:MAG: DUF4435 domain-containing protein [Nitrosomonadales bacterium]|nr:DUF4435 domain-containing protein [Nitrosomonadales bacterium]
MNISSMESIPSYSEVGRAARDIFWGEFNDVNFYVEDEDQENLYFEILGRLFPEVRISQIFPLGGKEAVIRHVNDPVNQAKANRSIYIVDKDFDDLHGKVLAIDNLFYLSQYSVENLLIEENAVVQIAVDSTPKKKRKELEERIEFNSFLQRSIPRIAPLFCLFFVAQYFDLGIKNCDCKPEEYSKDGAVWEIDDAKILAYERKVRELLLRNNYFKNDAEFEAHMFFLLSANFQNGTTNIGGKFILALLYHYLRSKVDIGNVSRDSLCYRLARNGSLEGFVHIKEQIERFLRNTHVLSAA